jgi:hypothetical protein
MEHFVDRLLQTFLVPTSGRSPQSVRDRFKHWITVYSHPEKFTEDRSPHALAAKRKSARQCLKRLADRHPEVAAALMSEREQERLQQERLQQEVE